MTLLGEVSLFAGPAAVYVEGLAGDVGGFVGGEEGGGGSDFAGFAGAAEGDLRDDLGEDVGALEDPADHGGVDETGVDAVDADAMGADLGGDVAGEGFDSEFRGRVVGAAGE